MLKRLIFVFLLLVGVTCFAWVIKSVGFEKVGEILAEFSLIFLAIYIVNSAMPLIVPAVGWFLIARGEGIKVSVWDALYANFMGFPVNYITPSAYLGGEPLRALFISQKYKVNVRRVLATIIVGKFQELAGYVILMIICAVVLLSQVGEFAGGSEMLIFTALGITIAFFIFVAIAYFTNMQPVRRCCRLFAVFGVKIRRVAGWRRKMGELEQIIHDSFVKRWKVFLVAQIVTVLSALSVFIRPLLFFPFLQKSNVAELVSMPNLCLIFLISNFLSFFQIVPGSLGVFEGGLKFVVAKAGKIPAAIVPTAEAAVLGFCIAARIAELVILAIGSGLLVHYGLAGLATKPEQTRRILREQTRKINSE